MSCVNSMFATVGTVLTGAAVQVLPANIQRKALLLSNGGDTIVKVAIGSAPAAKDYFTLPVGYTLVLDTLIPAADVWASGPGTVVVGEAV